MRLLFGVIIAMSSFCALAPATPAEGADGDNQVAWHVGVAVRDITPTEPIWMAGYAARTEPSESVEQPIHAKVLVMRDQNDRLAAIVTFDLIGITPEMRTQIAERAAKAGIDGNSLLLNASHTHCGPELRDERLIRFGIDARYAALSRQYVRKLCDQVGDAIDEAAKQLQPATLKYTHARAGFAMNRRLPTENGFINSPNPDGPVDHSVPVLRAESADGKLLAVLFGYACHNTTLSFNKICGDYSGYAQAYVEQRHPGAVAMYVNGCSADQNPYPRRTLELAQQHGRALANAVETALETRAVREVRGPLGTSLQHATLDFAAALTAEQLDAEIKSSNKYARFHAQTMLEQLKRHGNIPTTYDCFPVQTLRFGNDLTLVALCGESVVDYSLRLKRELAGDATGDATGNATEDAAESAAVWVAGYSNHVFGYLPSLRVLKEGGYEGGGAMLYTSFPGAFSESVEDRIMSAVRSTLNASRKQQAAATAR